LKIDFEIDWNSKEKMKMKRKKIAKKDEVFLENLKNLRGLL
jgi:hypothetical protein